MPAKMSRYILRSRRFSVHFHTSRTHTNTRFDELRGGMGHFDTLGDYYIRLFSDYVTQPEDQDFETTSLTIGAGT